MDEVTKGYWDELVCGPSVRSGNLKSLIAARLEAVRQQLDLIERDLTTPLEIKRGYLDIVDHTFGAASSMLALYGLVVAHASGGVVAADLSAPNFIAKLQALIRSESDPSAGAGTGQ